jgi:ABC-type multidrug transport system fused ATPase/permease subunit
MDTVGENADVSLAWFRLWYFITAICAGVAIFIQSYCFSRAGWDMTAKLRSLTFAAVLRHDIEWFDEEKHSVSLFSYPLGRVLCSC